MSARLPEHVTLPLAELRDVLKRGSPQWRRCAGLNCSRLALLPQDRSWCDDCRERWSREVPP